MKKQKGFTLIEILIALLILGIGMSLIYTIFPLGVRISRQVQTLGRVSFFAQKKIEELKTLNDPPSDSSGAENDFSWEIKVSNFSIEEGLELKKVELQANWQEGENNRTKRFVTYLKY